MVYLNIVGFISAKLADSCFHPGAKQIWAVILHVLGQWVCVEFYSAFPASESLIIQFAIFNAILRLIWNKEFSVPAIFMNDFLRTTLVLAAKGFIHAVLQIVRKVFDDCCIVGNTVVIVHAADFSVHRGQNFNIRAVNESSSVQCDPLFFTGLIWCNCNGFVFKQLGHPFFTWHI